jgi:Domain of unknown function (DUF4177)
VLGGCQLGHALLAGAPGVIGAGVQDGQSGRIDACVSVEYKVLELREGLIGGKLSGDKLEKILNEHAAQGWYLETITSADVKGRLGPGAVEGLLVTFERVVG